MRSTVVIIVAGLLMAVVAGCGGRGTLPNTPNNTQAGSPNPTTDAMGMMSPVDALAGIPDRISSGLVLKQTGRSFEEGMAQLVVDEGAAARFSPAWNAETPGTNQSAYAIFHFDLKDYSQIAELNLEWGEEPRLFGDLWIGLSNWNQNSWDWHNNPNDGTLDHNNIWYWDYIKPFTGDMFVAVVLLGTETALLDSIKVGESAQGDWYMLGRDRQHTGQSPFVGAQTNNLKWSYDAEETVQSGPTIAADNTVYVVTGSNHLSSFNADGTLKWKYTIDPIEANQTSIPAIGVDGTVYVGTSGNRFYAINPDGSLKWTIPGVTGPLGLSANIAADGTIYVGSNDENLYAINPDGTQKWVYPTPDTTFFGFVACPAIGVDGTIYYSTAYRLYAIKPDGRRKWSYVVEKSFETSPAIGADGTIYVGFDENIHAVNPDGTQKWVSPTLGRMYYCPAVGSDGTVYIGIGQPYEAGKLAALRPDGSLKWAFNTPGGGVWSNPAIGADGTVYFSCMDGNIYAINSNGTQKWSFSTGGEGMSSPTIGVDGTVYVGGFGGKLYAFGE